MIDRRRMLKLSAVAMTGFYRNAFAQTSDPDYEDIQTPFPATYRLYGTAPALGPEEDKAREILEGSPKGATPLQTARYFEALRVKNDDGHFYNAQWPQRWNPVIVGFYQSTSLPKPYVYLTCPGFSDQS
jgi:hypothetical protein